MGDGGLDNRVNGRGDGGRGDKSRGDRDGGRGAVRGEGSHGLWRAGWPRRRPRGERSGALRRPAPGRRTRQRLPGDSFDDDESPENDDGRAAWPGGDGGG